MSTPNTINPKILVNKICGGDIVKNLMEWATRQDKDGDTVLHMAVIQKNESLCHILSRTMAQGGCNLDILNEMIQTPLHLACITNQHTIIRHLLSTSRTQPATKDRNGNTAIHLCVKHSDVAALKIVLEHLVDNEVSEEYLNIKNLQGYTALHLAAFYNKTSHIELLLNSSAYVDAQEPQSGKSPLYVAVQERNVESARILLEAGADPNLSTFFRDSPSQLASNINQRALFRLLSKYTSNGPSNSPSPNREIVNVDIEKCSVYSVNVNDQEIRNTCTDLKLGVNTRMKNIIHRETPTNKLTEDINEPTPFVPRNGTSITDSNKLEKNNSLKFSCNVQNWDVSNNGKAELFHNDRSKTPSECSLLIPKVHSKDVNYTDSFPQITIKSHLTKYKGVGYSYVQNLASPARNLINIELERRSGLINTEQPLDLSIRRSATSHVVKSSVMKERNVAYETRLKSIRSIETVESETVNNNYSESISKKKRTDHSQLNQLKSKNNNNRQQSVRIKQEVEKVSELNTNIAFPNYFGYTGRNCSEESETRKLLEETTKNKFMSTLYHPSERMSLLGNAGFIGTRQPHLFVPGMTPESLTAAMLPLGGTAFIAPNSIPPEYYSRYIQSQRIDGFGNSPLTWGNIAFVQAMKNLQQHKDSNSEIQTARQREILPNPGSGRNSRKSSEEDDVNIEPRAKLRSSLSDGAKPVSENNSISHNGVKFERRNSEPTLMGQVITDESSIIPPDLHSYTGCLPPHFLHLLQSSGNLPMSRREQALTQVKNLYIDPRNLQMQNENGKVNTSPTSPNTSHVNHSNGEAAFKHTGQIHSNHQITDYRTLTSPKNTSVHEHNPPKSNTVIIKKANNSNFIRNNCSDSTMGPNILMRGIKKSENRGDEFDLSEDEDNMPRIQISDDDMDDDFEDVLIETAKNINSSSSGKKFRLPNRRNSKLRVSTADNDVTPWRILDTLPAFLSYQYRNRSMIKTESENFIIPTKSGYSLRRNFAESAAVPRRETSDKSHDQNKQTLSENILCYPCCKSYTYHKCAGCQQNMKDKLDNEAERLMFNILRQPISINNTPYSSTKTQPNIVFCSQLLQNKTPSKLPQAQFTDTEKETSHTPISVSGEEDYQHTYTHKLFNASRANRRLESSKVMNERDHAVTEQSTNNHTESSNKDAFKRQNSVDGKLPDLHEKVVVEAKNHQTTSTFDLTTKISNDDRENMNLTVKDDRRLSPNKSPDTNKRKSPYSVEDISQKLLKTSQRHSPFKQTKAMNNSLKRRSPQHSAKYSAIIYEERDGRYSPKVVHQRLSQLSREYVVRPNPIYNRTSQRVITERRKLKQSKISADEDKLEISDLEISDDEL